jgi:hypothetical protein
MPAPPTTISMLLRCVATLKLADLDSAEGFPPGHDGYTEDLDLSCIHADVLQVLWLHFQTCCPAVLRCHVKRACTKRAFINILQKGMALHCDGANDKSDEYNACMALVVHFSDKEGDETPAMVHLPSLNFSFKILPSFMYCFPGSFFRHGTEYTRVDGINRYSCVLHLKMAQAPGGVCMNELLHEYYMLG